MDYAAVSALKVIADRFGVVFLIVHHLRKQEADDIQDCVSGTMGITGAADGSLILDRSVSLLQPPEVPASFQYGSKNWHFEPATAPQMALLENLGYDPTADYSKGQAYALIGAQPPSVAQMRLPAGLGFDVKADWSREQANIAIDASRKSHAAMLSKIKKAGVRVSADGWKLQVEAEGLTPDQTAWIQQHRVGLLLVALRA